MPRFLCLVFAVFQGSNYNLIELQGKDAEEMIQEKDRQLAVVQEELKAIKFDQATRQLEKEKENQVKIILEHEMRKEFKSTGWLSLFIHEALEFSSTGLPTTGGATQTGSQSTGRKWPVDWVAPTSAEYVDGSQSGGASVIGQSIPSNAIVFDDQERRV